MERVSDWMIANPVTVSPETPLIEAEWSMSVEGVRHLPVVDGDRLIGILSDRDLREAIPAQGTTVSVLELNYLAAKLTAADAMSAPVVTTGPDDAIEDAARLVLEHRIGCLPVVDGRTVLGILTTTDLLRAFVDRLGADRLAAPALER